MTPANTLRVLGGAGIPGIPGIPGPAGPAGAAGSPANNRPHGLRVHVNIYKGEAGPPGA